MNFLTGSIVRQAQIDKSLNLSQVQSGGASTSVPRGYLLGYSSLYCFSYLRSSESLPVARGFLSISSLKNKLTKAYAITKKKQMLNAKRGFSISMRQVPITQPKTLPMAQQTEIIVCISPSPWSISFLLCSTNNVSLSELITKPKKQSTKSVRKNRSTVPAISVNINDRQKHWPRLQMNRINLRFFISLISILRQSGMRRNTKNCKITSYPQT